MAERSDEAFIIVREFMTRGLGLTGLPLLVYARIYGFCESGSPYFESKAHLGKILGVDTRSVVRAVRKLEEVGLVFEVGRQELSKGRETKVYRIDFEAARRAKGQSRGPASRRMAKCHRMTAGRARAAFCMTRRHADP